MKSPEDRIAYAVAVRGWELTRCHRHPTNGEYWIVELRKTPGRFGLWGHCHTLENVLRWIRRQGRKGHQ